MIRSSSLTVRRKCRWFRTRISRVSYLGAVPDEGTRKSARRVQGSNVVADCEREWIPDHGTVCTQDRADRHQAHRHPAPGQLLGAIRPALRLADEGRRGDLLPRRLPRADHERRADGCASSTLEIAATWLAAGLDPERVIFYRQSDIPEIPELTWLLTCVTPQGADEPGPRLQGARSTRTRGRRARPGRRRHHRAVHVPGADGRGHPDVQRPPGAGRASDQVQHIEMARDIAQRFNHLYGEHLRAARGRRSTNRRRLCPASTAAR